MGDGRLERQQELYWKKMVDLRTAGNYMRLYRNYSGLWLTRVAVLRAIVSSVSIGGWAIWHRYGFIWAVLIMLSQVADALQQVFPMAKRHKAANEYLVALEALFIDAQLEWEGILAERFTADQISKRLHALRVAHHSIESKIVREDLPDRNDLFALAERDANTFLGQMYGVESVSRGQLDA